MAPETSGYKNVSAFLDRVAEGGKFLIGLLLSSMIVIMFASVFFRYVLNSPLTWSDQLSQWIFVWVTYLGTAVAYRKGIHIGVDVIVRRLGMRRRQAVGLVVDLVLGVFFLVVLYYGTILAFQALGQVYGSLELPPTYMYLAGPVSAALMLVFMIDSVINRLRVLAWGEQGEGRR